MKKLGFIVLIFLSGFFVRDLSSVIVSPVKAEVAGMDSYDLKGDYDFKKAVKSIVEDSCSVDGENISCY